MINKSILILFFVLMPMVMSGVTISNSYPWNDQGLKKFLSLGTLFNG